MSGRARALLVTLGSTVATICAVELLLALFGGEIYSPPLYPGDKAVVSDATVDARLGWKLPASATLPETTEDYSVVYHSNRQGFRSAHDFDASSKGARIAFLGDSYTFGSGVADGETFAERVERDLAGVQCDNYGIGGFGIDQMWQTLRHEVLPRRPRQVVLAFLRSDLDRSLTAYRLGHVWREKPTFHLEGGELVRTTTSNRPSAPVRWLLQRSRLYRLWLRAESSLELRHAIGYRWRLNRALFAAIRDDCASAGVPLLVVHVPVNRRSAAPLYGRELARLGIDYLDLQPLLPPAADALYFPHDRHWTAAGHAFAADAISAALATRGFRRAG